MREVPCDEIGNYFELIKRISKEQDINPIPIIEVAFILYIVLIHTYMYYVIIYDCFEYYFTYKFACDDHIVIVNVV